MAETFVVSAQRVAKWRRKYFAEYVRALQFHKWMGTDENKVIQVDSEIERSAGEVVHFPLITKLTGPGVTGNGTLEGNETALSNYDDNLTVDWRRKGVLVTKKEEGVTEMDIREAAKIMLKNWGMEQLREDIVNTLKSPIIGGLTNYADTSETNKDLWLVANTDRVRFGISGYVSGDHSAGLAEIDDTNDALNPANVRYAKRILKAASPAIRPIMIDGKGEWYVAFTPSIPFEKLKTSLDTIHSNAAPRSIQDNPLFSDGDIVFDGIIFKEIPEITITDGDLDTGGAGGIATAPTFICGAQAVGLAWGQKPDLVVDMNRDYKFRYGVGYEECLKVKKLFFNSVQHGVFTFYTSAVAS